MFENSLFPLLEAKSVTDLTGTSLMEVIFKKTNGEQISKMMSLKAFAELILGSIKKECTYSHISKEFFPSEYIDGYIANDNTYKCIWKEKGIKRTMAYSADGIETLFFVPYPDLIFLINVNDGVVTRKEVYATKQNEDNLYRYPFGNVSTSGSICMGNIDTKNLIPSTFAEKFFQGLTNNDFYKPGEHVVPKWEQTILLEKLEKVTSFPEKWLIPTLSNYKTITELKESLIE